MKKTNKDEHILFRLSKEEKEEFDTICRRNGYAMSRVLRLLMENWIEEKRKKNYKHYVN